MKKLWNIKVYTENVLNAKNDRSLEARRRR